MTEQTRNKYLHDGGILLGIVIFFFTVLILMAILARDSWKNGLKKEVSTLLEASYPNMYTVKETYPLKLGFSARSAAFILSENKHKKKTSYAVVLNISTFYGPYPAVFICTEDGHAEFVNFLCIESGIAERIASLSEYSSIAHWQNRVPAILSLPEGEK